jgi:S1-C subfamily serine protease
MQKNNVLKLVAFALIFPILALACSVFVPRDSQGATLEDGQSLPARPTQVLIPTVPALSAHTNPGDEQVYIDLYNRANPAVVNIVIYVKEGDTVVPLAEGSGFVYDSSGHIVTNAHVVHGSDQIDVIFSDGTILPADIVGEDLHSDLAVIKIAALPVGIDPLPLGDISTVQVGQTVIAIGNPFGLGGTLTRGVVSALGRTIPAVTAFSIPQSIQTDAAINPGNSGGPLLNLEGQVIGVNAQIQTQNQSNSNSGVGFAIPVSIISRVVPVLIEDGRMVWPWLGVTGHALDPHSAKAMDLPYTQAAYISEVKSNSPAEKAGMRGTTDEVQVDERLVEIGGDTITAIDGQPVNSFDDLLIYIALNGEPGKTVRLTVFRDGKYQDILLTLEPRPDSLQQ